MELEPGTVVVVSVVVVSVVGRTGGSAEPVVVVAGQLAEPHARSVGQHPPPWEAGQERYPAEQVRVLVVVAELVTVTVRVTVTISGGSVEVDVGEELLLEVVLVVEDVGADGVMVV